MPAREAREETHERGTPMSMPMRGHDSHASMIGTSVRCMSL
jgi:hypothetical protein